MKTQCCICGLDIQPVGDWTQGHNAEPVASGRCCDECNSTVVIPARLSRIAGAIEQIESSVRMFDPSDPSDVAAMRRMIALERFSKQEGRGER